MHPKHVYRLVKRGMPGLRVGGEWRFDRVEVRAWAGERGAASRSGNGPKAFKIVGPSGAGKTTLAERLIHDWTKAGLRVGYLKHAAHGFDLDRSGKDSHRATRAGAVGIGLLGPGQVAFLEAGASDTAELLVRRLFEGYDVVVVEGFTASELPCVVFAEERRRDAMKPSAVGDVVAVVRRMGRRALEASPPVVRRVDTDRIRALVERRLGLSPESRGPATR